MDLCYVCESGKWQITVHIKYFNDIKQTIGNLWIITKITYLIAF